jgi:uncharacterized protein YeaO (DUF488 family)
MGTVKVKRIYEPVEKEDGIRILVDRLWPRGVKKEDAHLTVWMKEIAPTTDLRKWFNHHPEKWEEFVARYTLELQKNDAVKSLLDTINHYNTVTLLYAARNEQYNHAKVLQQFMVNYSLFTHMRLT